MFWTLAIFLTVLAAATLASPFLRGFRPLPSRAGHDVEVYGAQLRELQGDLRRGVLPSEEAASAKAEIGRRLLRAAAERDGAAGPERPSASGRLASVGAVVAIVAACAAAIPFYERIGKPGEADRPLAARLSSDPANMDMRTLVAAAEARLRADPDDGRGWEAVLPVYLRLGRGADAVKAADNAIRLLGSTADRQAMKGEAQVQVASGTVTDEADNTFRRAIELDPANGPARFYLALGLSQRERYAEAVPAWQTIVDAGPADAPWIGPARNALEEARVKTGAKEQPPVASAAPQSGPDAGEMAAAAELSPADRVAMVQGMVSQLAERLKSAPNDPDGWKRLIRSYSVLGDAAKAGEAYASARAIFADGSSERRSLDEFAASLGLGERKATQ
ncbi:c-type cytochrome biogenesis protein CcmI [Aureimonas leprariae]|uniref:c-type cytochrome biogenesis protein CcmI n=1 Tax=Plantimonas leprariae TaxID=2615207 RepID=UPI0013866190|nr:c-type cytochrome biogenesis protein CcmI [Aureimonas leprariae]